MSQFILRSLNQAAIINQPAPNTRRSSEVCTDEVQPVDAERVRRVLTSIRDCAEWPDVPDRLKLYWISAYINSLLCRMAVDRTAEADAWLAQCHDVANRMRVALGEETTL